MAFYLFPSCFIKQAPKDTLVIFWVYEYTVPLEDLYLHELRRQIHYYLADKTPIVERIVFLTTKKNKPLFNSIETFFKVNKLTFTLNLTDIPNGLVFASFDGNGDFEIDSFNRKDIDIIRRNILLAGISQIFTSRGGIIGPTDYFHYVLPSGRHSNLFVRSGNIFKNGVEISFVALSILPFLTDNTSNIYCDTSTIIVLAQACIALKTSLCPGFKCPDISSFGSYNGIQDFVFQDAANSLFLISATFEGGLPNRVFEKIKSQTTDDFLITIFKIPSPNQKSGDPVISGKILYKLEDPSFDVNKQNIHIYNDNCKLCLEHNSTPIRIMGDDFLPERKPPKPILINENPKPHNFEAFLRQFVGRKIIACHRSKKEGNAVRELYLDLNTLHKQILKKENGAYNELFNKYLKQKLPASLILIIYLNDTASFTIAKQILDFYKDATRSRRSVELIQYSDGENFSSDIESRIKGRRGSILVVGSSIAQSRTILNVSRELRKIHERGVELCYFVSVVRTFTRDEFKDIKTNLLFGNKYKMETHSFESLFEIAIPDERSRNITPWQEEIDFYNKYLNKKVRQSYKFEVFFEERFELLKSASRKGLVDNLFLRGINGNDLKLNPGFVFFTFETPSISKISQADVYFTISMILHHLRTERYKSVILLEQTDHQRKILDPENFNRFNDAVIIACFLRACKPVELDYSYDDVASKKMAHIIASEIRRKGNASYEYILALVMEKIKLAKEDRLKLFNDLAKSTDAVISGYLNVYKVLNGDAIYSGHYFF